MGKAERYGISGTDDTISLVTPPGGSAIVSGAYPRAPSRSDDTPSAALRRKRHSLLVVAEERTLSGTLAELKRGQGVGAYDVTVASDAPKAMELLQQTGWHAYLFDEASYGLLSWLPEAERSRVQRRSVVVTALEAAGSAALTCGACLPAARLTRFSLDNALWQVIRHQQALPSQAPPEESIYDVFLRLARTDLGRQQDVSAALKPLVEAAAASLRVARASVWQIVDSPKRLRCLAMFDAGRGQHMASLEVPASDCPVYCMSLHNHRIMAVEDALRDPRTSELADIYLGEAGIGALLDAPIYLDGAVVGLLCCAHEGGQRRWSDEEQRAAASFADYAQLVLMAHKRRLAEEELASRRTELAQAQKMEALGRLAGGIAYDFSNLLTVISGRAQVLERALPVAAPYEREIRPILSACERASAMVGQLLAFARRGPRARVPVDINAVCDEVGSMLERTSDRRVSLARRLEAKPATVLGDADEIQRALLNLGINARDAMPEGGTLTFATTLARDERGREFVEVAVSDTGHGMSDEVKARVLEPFFTTKADGRSTGLGLAIVHSCVQEHGGALDFATRLGVGTTFRMRLPLDPAHALGGPRIIDPAAPRGGRLVLIDEDDEVRQTVASMLSFFGYRVHECATPFEGIRHFGERRSEVDLVLLDLAMGEMSGRDCWRALRLVDRQVRCLLLCGQDDDGDVVECLASGALGAIRKPFAMASLVRAVEDALARAPRPL
jgi:signal transduction histidine kinase/ActR/RegA family two-component response regulator